MLIPLRTGSLPCGNCQWAHSYGTVTLNGKVVREGTICDLDAYCWVLHVAIVEINHSYVQPMEARHTPMDEMLGINERLAENLDRQFP